MRTTVGILTILSIAAFARIADAQVIYVKAGATGTGASWSDPEGSLQNAIDSAGPLGQVRVGQGIYTPGPDPGDSFVLVNQVLVIGGYFGTPGTEGDANARDPNPSTNNTVLSAEIGGPGLSDNIITIVSGNQLGISDTQNTILDGFTLTAAARHAIDLGGSNSPTLSNLRFVSNGDGDPTVDYAGAGLTIGAGSSPRVEFCEFAGNLATAGAAVDISGGIPSFNNCQFQMNSAIGPPHDLIFGPAGGGAVRARSFDHTGGLDSAGFAASIFRNCLFNGNTSTMGSGGAILKTGSLQLVNCRFSSNECEGAGNNGNGGAVASSGGDFQMHACDYLDNRIENAQLQSPYTLVGGSAWYSSKERVQATCCRFFQNVCAPLHTNDGAVTLNYTIGTLTNFTLADNEAPEIGGVLIDTGGAGMLTVRNAIAWGNLPSPDFSFNRQIENFGASAITVRYCDIQDLIANDGSVPFGTPDGNIDLNPQFRDEPMGDLRPLKTSPAIDRGETPPVPDDSIDSDGDTNFAEKVPDVRLLRRVVDLPSAPNLGIGDQCGFIDIGAHEYVIIGDINNDGALNGLDIDPFTRCYVLGSVSGPCEQADLVTDGVLNFADLNCLIANLLGVSPCMNNCPAPPGGGGEGGEGGGGSQGMSGDGPAGAEGVEAASSLAGVDEAPPEEIEDPAFTARWNGFVAWLDANPPEAYPNLTEEEWNTTAMQMMIDMVYEGVAP